jgi:hypothetical protein
LLKLEEGFASCTQLRRFLLEHPLLVLERSAQGATDEVIATESTAQGYRSPMHPFVLPSTVKIMR